MADTIRTRAALLALLADNISADISAQDIRDVLVSLFGVYGGIGVTGGVTAQGSIGTSFVKFTGFALNEIAAGVTPDHTNDQVTIDNAGVYQIAADVSFSGSVNTTFTFNLQVDGSDVATPGAVRKLGSGGDAGDITFMTFLTLAAAEVLTLVVKADGATKSITPIEASLDVLRVS